MRTATDPVHPAATLIVFRIGFGLMMLASIIRFWALGWIEKLYIQPTFFFTYRHFEWVRPLGEWTYVLFFVVGAAALCVAVGYRYQLAIAVFFLGFTYIELMDKTTYLNHYYFISLLSLLLIFVPIPAGLGSNGRGRGCQSDYKYYVGALRLFVAVVYFYAGLAKLNSDWLLHAQPLSIWLPAKYDIPLLGDVLQQQWAHFAFAWGGATYDLAIPFLLYYKPTRWFAFTMVVLFHLLTWVLFPIGMFPFIMIVAATVFFDGRVHHRMLGWLTGGWRKGTGQGQASGWMAGSHTDGNAFDESPFDVTNYAKTGFIKWGHIGGVIFSHRSLVAAILAFHLIFPFRYLLNDGELFWTEEGYRFSWRVMLMEKAGMVTFTVEDPTSGRRAVVDNRDHLTVFQEKQMATQPDFILQFAHHLADYYRARGFTSPRVYADSFVALNGRMSQPYIDPAIDLTTVEQDQSVSSWLLPFGDTIYGL